MAKRFAIIGLSLLMGTATQAQTNVDGTVNTITTAVPFLRISPDARSGGMGDVGVALSADPNAQFWNVAKIPFAEKKMGISLTYTPWLKSLVPDIWLGYVSGYVKFGQDDNQALSASLRYFNLGDITFMNMEQTVTGIGKPREFSFDVGYSRRLSEYLSVGLSLRYIRSALAVGYSSNTADIKPGNAFAADVGVFYSRTTEISQFRSNNFSFGAVISNVGSKISYTATRKDFIPINLGIGAAYTASIDEYNKITFAADVNKLLVPTPQDSLPGQPGGQYYPEKSVISGILSSFGDAPGGFSEELREFQISVGAEYWYQDQFALRAGYFFEHETKGGRKYFSAGVGLKLNVLTINGSYLIPSGGGVVNNPLANTFRVSLVFEFNDFVSLSESMK